jgi:hypothetical protein
MQKNQGRSEVLHRVKSKYNSPTQLATKKSTSLKVELEGRERRKETRTGAWCVARLHTEIDGATPLADVKAACMHALAAGPKKKFNILYCIELTNSLPIICMWL